MIETEILEGNKLIAEFMDKELFDKWSDLPVENLKFHSSWDWLIPVVEKIADMEHQILISGGSLYGNYCNINTNVSLKDSRFDNPSKFSNMKGSLLELTYKTIVEFIEWYNQQKL